MRRCIGAVRSVLTDLAPHHPVAAFALEQVLHVHASAGRGVALGLEMDGRSGFILAELDGGDADVHGQKILALGKVIHYSLADRFLVLDVLFTAEQRETSCKGGH